MRKFLPRQRIRRERYRSYTAIWPSIAFAIALAMLAAGWIAQLLGPDDRLLVGMLATTLTAASIVYSLSRTREAAKDQYTLTLVAKRFDDGGYAENARIASQLKLSEQVKPETKIEQLFKIVYEDKSEDGKIKRSFAAYAIIPMLNYWEHVCTAYVDDRINRQIFEDLVQDLIRELVARYLGVLASMRAEDPTNMEHLCAVWFVLASDDERSNLCPKLGGVPQRLCPDDKWRWKSCLPDQA